jgi:hypothetical protein
MRIPLADGGSILIEAPGVSDGPVKVGRVGDAIRELPRSLQSALDPVTDTARAVLDRLSNAGPTEVEVEFGVNLALEAGAVITKSTVDCHLKVRAAWRKADSGQRAAGELSG